MNKGLVFSEITLRHTVTAAAIVPTENQVEDKQTQWVKEKYNLGYIGGSNNFGFFLSISHVNVLLQNHCWADKFLFQLCNFHVIIVCRCMRLWISEWKLSKPERTCGVLRLCKLRFWDLENYFLRRNWKRTNMGKCNTFFKSILKPEQIIVAHSVLMLAV